MERRDSIPVDGLDYSKIIIMMGKSRWTLTFLSSFLIVAALIVWLLFAPIKLGGRVEFIIITGNSMEPRVHQNDLILVRKYDEYQIGDAVAYQNSEINRIVFHRIVDGNSLHYIMQGDNNDWVDSYQPSASEILGKEWLFIPGAGKSVAWLKQPLNASLFAGIFGGTIMGFGLFTKKKKKGVISPPVIESHDGSSFSVGYDSIPPSNLPDSDSNKNKPNSGSSFLNVYVELGIFLLGIIALASLILFLISFLKPVTKVTNPDFPYSQSIKYEYNASAPLGVYNSKSLTSGDPIFTNLTCQINLIATYQIAGSVLEGLTGTHHLEAVISEPLSGWKRNFPLETEQVFTGDSFSSQVVINFCQLRAAITAMEEQTGSTSYLYNIFIEPNVLQTGLISGTQFSAPFNSALPFQIDETRVYVTHEDLDVDPLNQSTDSVQSSRQIAPNIIHLFSFNLKVTTARLISALCLLFSLAGLWLIFNQISKVSKKDKGLMVKLKYGGSLINTDTPPLLNQRTTVKLSQIDDLARLSEKAGTVILHYEGNGQHAYYVEANGVTYICDFNDVDILKNNVL